MENKIYSAINSIMSEIDYIGKDRNNKIQGYAFRGVDDIMNALHPLMTKNKVFTVPTVLDTKRETHPTKNGGVMNTVVMRVQYKLFADDGSFIETIIEQEGSDTSDKASGKALSAAYKYAMLQIFSIPTEDPKDIENDHIEQSSTNSTPKPSTRPIEQNKGTSEPTQRKKCENWLTDMLNLKKLTLQSIRTAIESKYYPRHASNELSEKELTALCVTLKETIDAVESASVGGEK